MAAGKKYPEMSDQGTTWMNPQTWVCWACGTKQNNRPITANFMIVSATVFQCMDCREPTMIGAKRVRNVSQGVYTNNLSDIGLRLYPGARPRPSKQFESVHPEVLQSYTDACSLFGVHAGAAGAYARRTLELLLEHGGYGKPTLADSIKAANAEVDADKKWPARLLGSLDYIREAGNFAVHVRRDQGLIILDVTPDEVSACLEVVEELIAYLYDEPAKQYARTVKLNEKLAAASKPLIPLPTLLYSPPVEVENQEEAEEA